MGGVDVLLYLVTVDNLGQIVCTSCIQTAANRVICYVPTQEVVLQQRDEFIEYLCFIKVRV